MKTYHKLILLAMIALAGFNLSARNRHIVISSDINNIYRFIRIDTTDEEKVAQVRVAVHTIDRLLPTYEKLTKENIPGESSEGNEIDLYLLDGHVKKIAAVFYGETGKKTEEYYFDDNLLVFYYSKEERYSMSLGSGDLKVVSVIEKRYYFFGGEIFLIKRKPESGSPLNMEKLSEETLKEGRRLIKLCKPPE